MTAPQEPRALDDLAGRPVLVVSPHLDDAALSAFALLRVAEQPPTVLTVFDGVPVRPLVRSWDLVCGFRDSTEAMRTRRAENAEAMDRLGCVHLSLGLLDSLYLPGDRGEEDAERLRASVWAWAGGHPGAVVAVPAGAGLPTTRDAPQAASMRMRRQRIRAIVSAVSGPIGRGILDGRARWKSRHSRPVVQDDHLFVREALTDVAPESVAGASKATVVLYEEIPYLWGSPADDAVAAWARLHGRAADLRVARVEPADKACALAAYASQIGLLHAPLGRLDSPSGLPIAERYWVV